MGADMSGEMIGVLILIVAVFFVIRAVVLWYFKLDQIADNLVIIAKVCQSLDQRLQNESKVEASNAISLTPSPIQGISPSLQSRSDASSRNLFAPK